MPVEFRMPKMGLTMDTGEVKQWLKKEGDPVSKGEPIAIVETEKITNDLESPADGILRQIIVPAGSDVPVGTLLAWIGEAGEPLPTSEAPAQPAGPAATPAAADVPVAAGVAQPESREIKATPIAKRLAKEHGIDLSLVKPQHGDHIGREDVLAFIEAQKAAGAASAAPVSLGLDHPEQPASPEKPYQAIPISGMRKSIAEHLTASLHTSAQLSIANEVDVTELVQLRELLLPGFVAAAGIRLTYTDLFIALTARALLKHPILNSTLVDNEVRIYPNVNMGIAVAIENGLIVPVIHQAQNLSLGEIARARSELARKAMEGRLSAPDLADGTFTITNPGRPGSDISTPILNAPQNAILGIGRIVKKPVVRDDAICIRAMCWLSLTFDHRAMDGIPTAAFLDTLTRSIEDPRSTLGIQA